MTSNPVTSQSLRGLLDDASLFPPASLPMPQAVAAPKLRTGGVTADAFPDEATLATCLAAIIDRRTPFKCTAGLHHAVRHTAADTGFEHHGFLNVLLAVPRAARAPARSPTF